MKRNEAIKNIKDCGTDQQEHPEMETPTLKKLIKIAKTALRKGKKIEKDLEILCS